MSGRTSAIYVGRLRHRRLRPREHAFTYRTYHVLLDLDELEELDRDVIGFGHNRAAVTSLHDTDHLGDADRPLRAKLDEWLCRQGITPPDGRVLLLTNLRVLGHVFNPVSWFYCHDRDGTLRLVVAEVSNTFGETYCYLLDDLERTGRDAVRARRSKVFHVSPFLPIDGLSYDFTLRPPGQRTAVHMDVRDAEGKVFDATLAERRVQLTSTALWRVLLTHPLMTLRTVLLIHWQALRLWLKRVPFFRKPPLPPDNGLAGPSTDAGRRDLQEIVR